MNVIGYSVFAIGVGLPQFKTEEEAKAYAEICNGIVIPIVDVEILKEVQ